MKDFKVITTEDMPFKFIAGQILVETAAKLLELRNATEQLGRKMGYSDEDINAGIEEFLAEAAKESQKFSYDSVLMTSKKISSNEAIELINKKMSSREAATSNPKDKSNKSL